METEVMLQAGSSPAPVVPGCVITRISNNSPVENEAKYTFIGQPLHSDNFLSSSLALPYHTFLVLHRMKANSPNLLSLYTTNHPLKFTEIYDKWSLPWLIFLSLGVLGICFPKIKIRRRTTSSIFHTP